MGHQLLGRKTISFYCEVFGWSVFAGAMQPDCMAHSSLFRGLGMVTCLGLGLKAQNDARASRGPFGQPFVVPFGVSSFSRVNMGDQAKNLDFP